MSPQKKNISLPKIARKDWSERNDSKVTFGVPAEDFGQKSFGLLFACSLFPAGSESRQL